MQLPGSKLCSYGTLRTAAAGETFKVHNVENKLESLLMCELICYVCAKPTNCPGLKTEEFTGYEWKLVLAGGLNSSLIKTTFDDLLCTLNDKF